MLLILILLFFPCAVVGAFVAADDYDLTAFLSRGLSSVHSSAGAICRCSDACAKDMVPSRGPKAHVYTSRRQQATYLMFRMLINSPDSSPLVCQPGTSGPDGEVPPSTSGPPDLLYFDMSTPDDPEAIQSSSGPSDRLCFNMCGEDLDTDPSSGSPERVCFDMSTDGSEADPSTSGSPDRLCLDIDATDTKPSSPVTAESSDRLDAELLNGDEGKKPMSTSSDFRCVDLDIAKGYQKREGVRRAGHRRGRTPSSARASDLVDRVVPLPTWRPLLSVDHLREIYGSRRNFWGDLSAREARIFYKELLPETIRREALARGVTTNGPAMANGEEGSECCDIKALEELARLASTARHVARLYTRERCVWLPRFLANAYDGCRHLWKYGTFRMTGATWDELYAKYEAQIVEEDPHVSTDELKQRVYFRIVEKACCTSEAFDKLVGLSRDTPIGGKFEDANECAPERDPTGFGSMDPDVLHDGVAQAKCQEGLSEASVGECPKAGSGERRMKLKRWILPPIRARRTERRGVKVHVRERFGRSYSPCRGRRRRQ